MLGKNPRLLNSGRQDKAFFQALWATVNTAGAWRGEIWNRRKSGELFAELASISAIRDGEGRVQRYLGVFSDISNIKAHEEELRRIAHFDALTGVPNRVLLADRLNQAIIRARRPAARWPSATSICDGFKIVNDQYGHEAGDRLLLEITTRLSASLRAGDTLARLGGDEFVILFNDLLHEEESLPLFNRALETIAVPVDVGANEGMSVTASIGITFYPADREDGDTLLRHADQAMYLAKQMGKNRYHLYDPIHDHRLRSLHESRQRISHGLGNGEFELYYQPKIVLATGQVVGAEALFRWNHPQRGLLAPAEILPLVEGSELEITLGEWVVDQAVQQLCRWEAQDVGVGVSINIGARHLQSAGFVAYLTAVLARHRGGSGEKLQIEILETAALEDIVQSSETISACRALGVRFALDDFGTGYSSLAYLHKLAADTLKIDQSFLRRNLEDAGDRAIVQGVIALARTFGMDTVAEGIEQVSVIPVLAAMGCSRGQGYAIAQPMPVAAFTAWYRARQPGAPAT